MGLRYKLLLPAIIAMFAFSIYIHFIWAQNVLEERKSEFVEHQDIILKTLEPGLARNMLAADPSSTYDMLNSVLKINAVDWKKLLLKNIKGERLFPLSHSEIPVDSTLLLITKDIRADGDVLGTVSLWVDWNKHHADDTDFIYQFELIAIFVAALFIFAGILWNHLIVIRPLSKLKRAANRLRQGDLSVVPSSSRKDELGELCSAFESMRKALVKTQEELREILKSAEEREIHHATVISSMVEALVTIDDRGCIESINDATEKLFGYQQQELIGKNIKMLMPETHSKHHDSYLSRYDKTRDTHVIGIGREIHGLHKDGHSFPIDISINEMMIEDRKLYCGVMRDISERKQAENELRDSRSRLDYLLTSSPAVIYSCRARAEGDFGATFISNNVGAQLGYAAEIFTSNSSFWADNIHPDDKEKVLSGLSKLFEHGSHAHEYRFKHANGHYCWIHDELKLVKDDNDKPLEIIGSWLNISKRKKAEQERLYLQQQLQQAKKMETIGQLTGGVAHDFNNILTTMMGNCDLAMAKYASEDNKLSVYLQEIYQAGARARNLVKQMLTFSRGESGHRSVLSAGTVLQEINAMLRSILPASIELRIEVEDKLPKINIDPVQLQQLIINVVTDAQRSMGKQGCIKVSMFQMMAEDELCMTCQTRFGGEFVSLSISTNCISEYSGQDAAILTVDDMPSEFQSSKSFAKTVMHEHGGHIQVDSITENGVNLYMLFPIADTDSVVNKSVSESLSHQEVSSKARILIVDDEVTVAHIMSALLTNEGFLVTVENSSAAALEHFRLDVGAYDLMLTDQMMPGMTGTELAKEIFQMRTDLPIILYTATKASVDEAGLGELGIDLLLEKPIELDVLLSSVNRLLKPHLK